MMNARNSNALDRQIERFQDIMVDDRTRFGQRQQQQQYQMNRQNQIMNQLINMENQRNTFDRFFQQQRPLYSHRQAPSSKECFWPQVPTLVTTVYD